jgi:hypothetical protein
MAWYAKEVVRSMFVYEITGQQLAVEFADQLAESLQDPRAPGRGTLPRPHHRTVMRHEVAHVRVNSQIGGPA